VATVTRCEVAERGIIGIRTLSERKVLLVETHVLRTIHGANGDLEFLSRTAVARRIIREAANAEGHTRNGSRGCCGRNVRTGVAAAVLAAFEDQPTFAPRILPPEAEVLTTREIEPGLPDRFLDVPTCRTARGPCVSPRVRLGVPTREWVGKETD